MKYTVCFIFSQDMREVLMMHKMKGPFPGCLNGVGGKIEESDQSITKAALREIREETYLQEEDFRTFKFLVTLTLSDTTELNVFYGVCLDKSKVVQKEEEILEWMITDQLLDVRNKRLAGDGNIPYFIYYSLLKENSKENLHAN